MTSVLKGMVTLTPRIPSPLIPSIALFEIFDFKGQIDRIQSHPSEGPIMNHRAQTVPDRISDDPVELSLSIDHLNFSQISIISETVN